MGCIVALFALISPRLAIFLLWLFTNRMTLAFDYFWMGFLGFLFLPWTTLAWALVYQWPTGPSGFGWILVFFGLLIDVSAWFSGAKASNRN